MLESPAYRALSWSGHMVISRIEIELSHHGGNDNGRLPVTTDDFVAYGMHRTSVAPAIREAEALGFIRVTVHGHGGNAEHRISNQFLLTFAHGRDSRVTPTHEWRRIKTLEGAKRIACDRGPPKTRTPLRTENDAGRSESKIKKPVRKILPIRYRKTTSRALMPVRQTRTTRLAEKPYHYL